VGTGAHCSWQEAVTEYLVLLGCLTWREGLALEEQVATWVGATHSIDASPSIEQIAQAEDDINHLVQRFESFSIYDIWWNSCRRRRCHWL
jgi:hypothetical protein